MVKPVIGMMAVVRDMDAVDQLNGEMTELGYEPMGEFGISSPILPPQSGS